jgi:hypothetical protein
VTIERVPPKRRTSLLRLLAAALAGGIGTFGVPAGAHANAAPQSVTRPSATAPDTPSARPD